MGESPKIGGNRPFRAWTLPVAGGLHLRLFGDLQSVIDSDGDGQADSTPYGSVSGGVTWRRSPRSTCLSASRHGAGRDPAAAAMGIRRLSRRRRKSSAEKNTMPKTMRVLSYRLQFLTLSDASLQARTSSKLLFFNAYNHQGQRSQCGRSGRPAIVVMILR